MKCRLLLSALLLLALAFTIGPARAQEATTGSIEGTVMDPSGQPLAGATVTITSAQGTKTATSGADGHFRFQYLIPGTYGLTASLHGYVTAERQDIKVGLMQKVRAEVTLTPGVSQEIEVVGAAPVVDLSSTTTGANITSSMMASIPLGRTFANTLALAPGVVESGIDNSNPSIAGASGLENTYIVDGMNIGNTGYGSAGSYSIVYGSLGTGVNYDYIQEVQVKTGGYEPEYGEALGGVVNLITKSGGNKVTGSVFSYQQFADLEATAVRTDRLNATYDPISYGSHDYGFEIGGPVIKDQAFWFGAFDPTFTTRTRRTSTAIASAQGFDHTVDVDRTIYNYAANLKWLVTPNQTVTLSAFGDPSKGKSGPQRVEAVAVPDPTVKYSEITYGGNNVVGHWNGQIVNNWFVEGMVAHHQDKFNEDPANQLPQGIDRRPNANGQPELRYGGIGFFEHSTSKNTQYQLKLANYLHGAGEHNLRYGAEYQDIRYSERPNYSGPSGIQILQNDGSMATSSSGYQWDINAAGTRFRVNRIRSGSLGAETKTRYTAGFVSDTWNPTSYISVMAGVRYETEKLIGNLTEFTWKDNWSPRFHLTVDPTRDNKTKIEAAYGRYFGKVPNDLAVRALSAEVTYQVQYYLKGPDHPDGVDISDPEHPTGLVPANQIPGGVFAFGNTPTTIDPNAKLSYEDEYVVGAQREVIPFLSVGVTYMHRQLGRTLEDTQDSSYVAILAGTEDFGEYIITNPGPPFNPKPTRKYDAVTVKVEKRLSHNWQGFGSYTYSKLRGNYEGYFRRDNGQSDPFVTSAFDFPYLLDPEIWGYASADGKLPNDRPHVVNAYGSYQFPFLLTAGLSLKVASGVPITKLGYNEVYGNGGEIVLEPRGASGRGPTTTDIGLHLDYPINLGMSGKQVEVTFDVFNLLNTQKGIDFDYEYELGGTVNPPPELQAAGVDPCPECVNPDFAKPTTFQAPRQYQFALRAKF